MGNVGLAYICTDKIRKKENMKVVLVMTFQKKVLSVLRHFQGWVWNGG